MARAIGSRPRLDSQRQTQLCKNHAMIATRPWAEARFARRPETEPGAHLREPCHQRNLKTGISNPTHNNAAKDARLESEIGGTHVAFSKDVVTSAFNYTKGCLRCSRGFASDRRAI